VVFAELVLLAAAGAVPPPAEPHASKAMRQAIEEFKTQTRELGMRPDSPRAARTRGPRPQWHGRVYENFRNDALDAIPHEIRQRGEQQSVLRRNQFGVNVAGPLIVPRLIPHRSNIFFSFSYEGVRERISRTYLRTIPTLPERTGDFSREVDQAGNLLPIYDPATIRTNPQFDPSQPVSTSNLQYIRDPFPGNRIPANRLDPTVQQALKLYPSPNASVGPFFENNFFINSPETNIANGVIANIDAPFNVRHRFSAEMNYSNGLLGAARWFDNAANPALADRTFQTRRGALQHVYTASPRTINTLGFEAASKTTRAGGDDEIFPVYEIEPYVRMGRRFPVSAVAKNDFEWSEGLSLRRGKHSIRFSAAYVLHQVNAFLPEFPEGYFRFSPGLTSLPGIVNTGHAFAGFLLGLPEYVERSIVTSPSYFRRTATQIGVRDYYNASRGLTFSFGLNAHVWSPRVEKYDRQSTVDFHRVNPANGRPGALVAAGQDGATRGFRPVIAAFDPSIAAAWNPWNRSDTVLRLEYDRWHAPMEIYGNQWGAQGFNAQQTFISPNVQLQPALSLADGIPPLEHPLPDLRPEAANGTVADLIDATDRLPVLQAASLSLEQQLPGSVVVTVGVSHRDGHFLFADNPAANPNAISPDALRFRDLLNNEDFNSSLRPFPQYKRFDVNASYPVGRYRRDRAFLRIAKRSSNGLSLNAEYTYSRQFDDYSGWYGIQDFFNRDNDWAPSPVYRPSELELNYVYEIPFGSNKPLFDFSDWRRRLVDGWSLSGDLYLASGRPLQLIPAFNNTGGVIQGLHVDAVPGVDPAVADQGPELWFNPAAFRQPADFSLGDAPRTITSVLTPPMHKFDINLTKRLPMSTDQALELTASAFNVLNHADWDLPDTTIGPASAPNVNAGRILGSHGGRVIQLGLRLSF
jgi:hypothetical protein